MLLDLLDVLSHTHHERACLTVASSFLHKRFRIRGVSLRRGHASTASETEIDIDIGPEPLHLAFELERRTAPQAIPLRDIARVIASSLRHARAIARVAQVSRRAHERSRLLAEDLRERAPHDVVVAVAPSTRRIFTQLVPAIAPQNVSVLIFGETGTGKELVARRIHELSPRARQAFVRVNCGAIPATLIESTLFGHERGAFTGAIRSQRGVFERAHGGTLFLDEVGELSPSAQVKLLRVLESGEVQRVGGEHSLQVDVRIVAATHRDLHAMVESREFRADLYFRLDVVTIRVPPLRERPTEIDALARHLLADIAHRMGRPVPSLHASVRQRLRAHSWPGNVRELRNVLERSLLFSEDGAFDLEDLPATPPGKAMTYEEGARRCIEAALAQSGGRVYGPGGAAEILDLKPTTLMSKMQKLRVSGRLFRR